MRRVSRRKGSEWGIISDNEESEVEEVNWQDIEGYYTLVMKRGHKLSIGIMKSVEK